MIPRPGNAEYQKMGFRCGLEIHYQLATSRKLFCRCPVGLRSDPPDAEIIRHMRPTLSELGEYDGTALMEYKTRKEVHYQLYYDTVCTYEMDDTPPFTLNREALDITLEIALLLNCQVVDEIHVSRKQYLDGSIPTGFQRTIAVGVDGWIPFRDRKIRILQLCLEEDACREMSDRGHVIVLRTDRLSTPLVEVITAADMRTPEEAAAVDREIGRLLRATGRVRRGIGTVRQDVNVSVEGGVRAEIKGVPRTGMIPPLVHYEALRQSALLSLREELAGRAASGAPADTSRVVCTDLFGDTTVTAISNALAQGHVVGAVRLGGFAGLLTYPLGPHRTFADELRGRVRVIACLDSPPVLLHPEQGSDDRIAGETWREVRSRLGAGAGDAVVLVWGPERDVHTALGEIADRAREAREGVPGETRQALASGETDFERILPGPDRMYPDTDSPPIPIERERLESMKRSLPRTPWSWREAYQELTGRELIDQVIDRDLILPFDRIAGSTGADPKLVAVTLLNARKSVLKERRGGRDERQGQERARAGDKGEKREVFDAAQEKALTDILSAHRRGGLLRGEIGEVFSRALEGEDVVSVLAGREPPATGEEIARSVNQVLEESGDAGDRSTSRLIGMVKSRIGRPADGRDILRALKTGEKRRERA